MQKEETNFVYSVLSVGKQSIPQRHKAHKEKAIHSVYSVLSVGKQSIPQRHIAHKEKAIHSVYAVPSVGKQAIPQQHNVHKEESNSLRVLRALRGKTSYSTKHTKKK